MLSDIALGLPGAVVGWRRGEATLALLPTSQFPDRSFEVYYEIYNLPAGHRYTTEITIEEIDEAGVAVVAGAGQGEVNEEAGGAARGPVRLRFSGESDAGPDGALRELRRVDTSLGRGRYRLTVVVTDEQTGRTAQRSRRFHVRGWGPGATLVPALPRTAYSRP